MDLLSIYIKITLLIWFTFCVAGIVAHILTPNDGETYYEEGSWEGPEDSAESTPQEKTETISNVEEKDCACSTSEIYEQIKIRASEKDGIYTIQLQLDDNLYHGSGKFLKEAAENVLDLFTSITKSYDDLKKLKTMLVLLYDFEANDETLNVTMNDVVGLLMTSTLIRYVTFSKKEE